MCYMQTNIYSVYNPFGTTTMFENKNQYKYEMDWREDLSSHHQTPTTNDKRDLETYK